MHRRWIREDDRLTREFTFGNFTQAMIFVNKIADAAEESNHHPLITIDYNKVTVVLWTHSAKKVTAKDLNLAEKIDEIPF